jgi:hypothetical protein
MGANFYHLWVEQGILQLMWFLKHWRLPQTQLGQLLPIAISWFQVALGTGISFLVDTDTTLPHFESKWLRLLRNFLSHCDGSLSLDDHQVSSIQRNNDIYIMDTVLVSDLFTAAQICRINYCRLYLQAITLSDICDDAGEKLDLEMFFGRHSPDSSHTTWHSFNRPSKFSWSLWCRACWLFTSENGALQTPH